MNRSNALYLVDASIYIFRAYHSIPASFIAVNGQSVNAVYGYTQFLLDLLKARPGAISVAFDESLNTCYRNEIYPDYKANRDLPDENLEFQFARCQEITALLGFHYLSLRDFEADDIIGTLATRFSHLPVIIVTRDKDLGQLLRAGDEIWDFAANQFIDRDAVKLKFGVEADQIADYLALAGDSVDNIPGAPGVGAKTAATLLAHFGSIDVLYESLDEISTLKLRGSARIHQALRENEARVRMYQSITRIKCDVPMQVQMADLAIQPGSTQALDDFCVAMRFGDNIRARIHENTGYYA